MVVCYLKNGVAKIFDFVDLSDPFLPGGGSKQCDPKTKGMGRTHTLFLLPQFKFEEQHISYRIWYSEKRLQGSVLPGKHTPEKPFSTEQTTLIVRQRKR
jgi:hypothetical protein